MDVDELIDDDCIDVFEYENCTVFTKPVKPYRVRLYFMDYSDLIALEKSLRSKIVCLAYYEEVCMEIRRRNANTRRMAQEA